MARQSTSPVSFNRTIRPDSSVTMTSEKAGVITPVGYIPLHAGDSCSGRAGIDISLKEMPKPLLNGAFANIQAWFIPKSAHPQFSGRDELNHARSGAVIKSLGAADRTPPPFFTVVSGANLVTVLGSRMFKQLGIHVPAGQNINSDLIDAFNVMVNFRRAAISSRLPLRKYFAESANLATQAATAFWPSQRFADMVPDYERALVVGSLDLDILAGRLPVSGFGVSPGNLTVPSVAATGNKDTFGPNATYPLALSTTGGAIFNARVTGATAAAARADIWAEMAGRKISTTLADIDKARTTQAFAKLRAAYAGNDSTGFDNDDTIVALLMQGIPVSPDQFKRPWLLDSKRVPIGFTERNATDGASLSASVTLGRASASLSLNVPMQDTSGVIIITVEVLPERIDERMSDEWLYATVVSDLPNALRDVQRTEPVDLVLNRRIDAKHTVPSGLYAYEPMNHKWKRNFTRLGGDFFQATPGAGWTENRSAIWQHEIIDPVFSSSHYLAPSPFPQDVFADQLADAFEVTCRHSVSISGLTQMGDLLAENGPDYDTVKGTI